MVQDVMNVIVHFIKNIGGVKEVTNVLTLNVQTIEKIMKPLEPWPNPEGYSERDKEWLSALDLVKYSYKRFRQVTYRIGLGIILFVMIQNLSGQELDRTLVIDTPKGSVVLEVYHDPLIKGHFYIFQYEGVTEIWELSVNEWVITEPSGGAYIMEEFFIKDSLDGL